MSRDSKRQAAVCPCTGLTIPECSCQRCLEEQIRSFSPLMRSKLRAVDTLPPDRIDPRHGGRAAA